MVVEIENSNSNFSSVWDSNADN